ncbi:MAG: peptidoglycan recognition family protein, partial [Candidatus Competibacterales bacterium]|nr:peptidoglycan recognition family protein [Candidatus Competibacterales bacterium]
MGYPGTNFWIASPNHIPRPQPIQSVIIHTTQGPSRDEGGAINKFMRRDNGSIHYIVNRSGIVTQMVRDDEVANHVGGSLRYWANVESIGIEHVNPRGETPTPALYEVSSKLVFWLCTHYSIPLVHETRSHAPGIKDHEYVSPRRKPCPGTDWDWNHYM